MGYTAPITTFTGRFLDSTATTDWFRPFRTARAYQVVMMPSLDRIYFRYGNGTVVAYQLSTFFSRLEGGETLLFPYRPVPGDRSGSPEVFLNWHAWFNPELASPAWTITNGDGSIRMPWFDVDDRANVYVASTVYGWGLVKDDLGTNGNAMKTIFQKFPGGGNTASPSVIVALKSGTRYYAYLSSSSQTLWDVTTPGSPVQVNVPVPPLPQQYAKNAGADHFATIDLSGKLSIYDVGSFVSGAAPQFSAAGYSLVTSDGTNFFALKAPTPNANGIEASSTLDVYSATGTLVASNPITVMTTTGGGAVNMRVSDNVLVITGLDNSAWDMHVYKLGANYAPTRLPINTYPAPASPNYPSYFRSYYSAAPAGFGTPPYINIVDGTTYKAANGNTYLILVGRGLGDVYQLQPGDSISPSNDGSKGSVNSYAPAPSSPTVFYGDPMQFTGRTQSTNVSNIGWNFGNPEAGLANTQTLSGPNAPVPYTYTNLTKATIGTKTVTATSLTDATVKGAVSVALMNPVARFGILQTPPLKFLFAAPNASSPAPIVDGDSFIDASDGSIEGHYASWTLDGVANATAPNTPVSVGPCGSHSLVFQDHYGPYTNVAGVFTTTHPASATGNPGDFIVGLDPTNPANSTFNYIVKPFAAVIDVLGNDATNVNFTGANSRGIASATVTNAGGLTWTWEALDSTGNVIPAGTSGTPQSFSLPKSTFQTYGRVQIRLTLQTVNPIAGACAGFEKSVALSPFFVAPDPKIISSGDGTNTPFTFTAASVSNADMTGWTYKWTVNGAAPDGVNVSSTSTSGSTFSPSFLKSGTYTIGLTATNAISAVAAPNASVTIAVAACAKLASNSFLPSFTGATTNCGNYNGSPACNSGESVTFIAQVNTFIANAYNPSCAVTTYVWKFPDGSTQTTTDAQVTQTVTAGGTVTLTVSNTTGDSATYTVALTVGSNGGGGGGGGNPCAGMTSQNIFVGWNAPSCPNGIGTCSTSDTITFNIQAYNYNQSCINGGQWNFGDGTGTGVTTSHKFATDGNHSCTVTVTNSAGGTAQRTFSVQTQPGSSGGGGGGCGTMTTQNVFVDVNGASCPSGAGCTNNDILTFTARGYLSYDFSCATHTYDWDFGDGSAHSTAQNPTHSYATTGLHSGTVTLKNLSTNQTFVRTFSVQTQAGSSNGGGSCGPVTPNLTLSINFSNPAGTCGPLATTACGIGEAISFNMLTYNYNIGCATHTYDWNFGDGTAHSADAAPVHQYSGTGKYHVTLIVNNGQSYTLSSDVQVGSNNPATGTVTPTIIVDGWTGVENGYIFNAHFDHPELVKSWTWNFGDGTTKSVTTDSASNPTPVKYAYSDSKKYTVTLTSYGSTGQPNGTDNTPNEPTAPSKRRSVRH